jgi:CheY-like chemotaxis protein
VGLGLAISRQLCERMGGTLVSGTSPAGGARFVASFPASAAGSASGIEHYGSDDAPARLDRSFAKRHPLDVLVIDDMEPAREFLRAVLSALGYDAAIAGSAEDAFRRVEERRFGLVLVDIQMPGVDGWAAARGLRARLGPEPCLVALTANALANDSRLLEQVGFDGFAQKPLRIGELMTLLRRAHARGGVPQSEFDGERWRELAAVAVAEGETLLDRMRRRVLDALPEARRRLAAAREGRTAAELVRALHDLHGLLSLLGATRAAASMGRAERAAESGSLDAETWQEIEQRLDAVVAELTLPRPRTGPRD